MSDTRLSDLAKAILDDVSTLENYLRTNGIPAPSFDENAPLELPLSPQMRQIRQRSVDAAAELQELLTGPVMLLRPVLNATSLQAIYRFDIASKVPLGGRISLVDLAKEVGLERTDLERILRFAMIHHRVFQEKEPGIVSHTAASRLLAESPDALAALGFMFDECYQSYGRTVECLGVRPGSKQARSGWAIANDSDLSLWEYHALHPELSARAARAMAAFTRGSDMDTRALTRCHDWSSLDADKGLVVDIGGASGQVAFELAHANPNIRCIIQEIPEVVAKAGYTVPQDLTDRVTFAAHDFFTQQPTRAQVYLFRQILHNWSDDKCIEIIRVLIPALTPGAKVLINDDILPPPGTLPPTKEKAVRSMDMIMMTLFRSRERGEHDWKRLFVEADGRFGEVKAWQPPESQLGLIEATWSG